MGTANFYVKNASKYFVVLENQEDEDGNDIYPNEWDIEDLKSDIHEQFEKLPFNFQKDDSYDDERSFQGTCLGTMWIERNYGDISVGVKIDIILRSGYYEAAVLDWETKLLIDDEDITYDDLFNTNVFDHTCTTMGKGLQQMFLKHIAKWLSNTEEKLITETEKIFENVCSTKLICVGRASNGEAFYQKV